MIMQSQPTPAFRRTIPFSDSSNLSPSRKSPLAKPPRFSFARPQKALPTLAITRTTAKASCVNTITVVDCGSGRDCETNVIPFPSSPIDLTSPSCSQGMPLPIELPTAVPALPPRRRALGSLSPPVSNPHRAKRVKRSKTSTTRNKDKRAVADIQFLATVHGSIVWSMLCAVSDSLPAEGQMDVDCEVEGGGGIDMDIDLDVDGKKDREGTRGRTLEAQDKLLAVRLGRNLLEIGCTSALFDTAPSSLPPDPILDVPDAFPISTPPQASTPGVSSPTSTSPLPSPTPTNPLLLRRMHVPIMSMPQLVAALILRHHVRERDGAQSRRRTHSRVPSLEQSQMQRLRPRSPLASPVRS